MAIAEVLWPDERVDHIARQGRGIRAGCFGVSHILRRKAPGDEHQAVRDAATSRGLDETALIREWVKESSATRRAVEHHA